MSDGERTGLETYLVPDPSTVSDEELTGSHTRVRTCKQEETEKRTLTETGKTEIRKQRGSLLIYNDRITTGLSRRQSFSFSTLTHTQTLAGLRSRAHGLLARNRDLTAQ